MQNINKITLYCDGACQGNPGDGGWAFVLKFNFRPEFGEKRDYAESGYVPNTTNNQMELLACIMGLNEIYSFGYKIDEIEIITDSQYLVNTMAQGWKKGKNQELWNRLDSILTSLNLYNTDNYKKLNIKWTWVKGHNGNLYNEMCDKMAVQAYREKKTNSLIEKDIVKDSDTINIIFNHIMKYTYSNEVIDIYEYKPIYGGDRVYASEVNGKQLIAISTNMCEVQRKAEEFASPLNMSKIANSNTLMGS